MGTFWMEAISGERRDALARVATALLLPASALYRAAVYRRNWRYDTGRSSVHRAACPAVSVGNITVGGTGKTPFVEWAIRALQACGRHPVVLSRGYGGADGTNDEADLLAENCPGVATVCNPDRVAGAAEAIRVHGADCLVLDDGFQHRRLHRDLDIVLIDATRPFGRRRLLPAGSLREPLSALRRADAIVLTRSDQVRAEPLAAVRAELARLAPDALLAQAVHRPVAWLDGAGTRPPDWIEDKAVVAVSGVGNPGAFEQTVVGLKARVAEAVRFGDHRSYDATDALRLARQARRAGAELVVTTQKDATKLRRHWPGQPPLAWLRVEMHLVSGDGELRRRLETATMGTGT